MKYIYALIILVLCSFTLLAQNWKTVSNKDTVYFQAGKHEGFPYVYDSSYLRAIWVTSSYAVPDSSFNFFITMRDTATQTGECLDTLASSWLGPRFVRKQTGTEYYFNSHNDTIEIRTNAHL